jgi:hypothetical protein
MRLGKEKVKLGGFPSFKKTNLKKYEFVFSLSACPQHGVHAHRGNKKYSSGNNTTFFFQARFCVISSI